MPPPRVLLSTDTGRFISENTVILTCTITLASTVNNGEVVATTWLGPNGQLINSSSVTLSNVNSIANGAYQSTLTITGFVPAVHNGDYTCNTTIIPSTTYVTGNSASTVTTVMISGKI